jgi:hypothetical protein
MVGGGKFLPSKISRRANVHLSKTDEGADVKLDK